MSSPRKILQSQENVAAQPPPHEDEELQQQPPKPPRTAFICFSDAKKHEIAAELGISENSKDILNHVSNAWRELSSQERAEWDEKARDDKVRYVREKAEYKGPWDVPKRRAKKHPLAPKRPMSAFLKFSKSRRAMVKKQNPDMSNTDVSRLLGEMWRNAPLVEKDPYIKTEERERAQYKSEIAKWRAEQARLDAESRTSHQAIATTAIPTRAGGGEAGNGCETDHRHHARHRAAVVMGEGRDPAMAMLRVAAAAPPSQNVATRPSYAPQRRTLPLNRDNSIFKTKQPDEAAHPHQHDASRLYPSFQPVRYPPFSHSYSFTGDSNSFDSTEPIPANPSHTQDVFHSISEPLNHQPPAHQFDENFEANGENSYRARHDAFGFFNRYP